MSERLRRLSVPLLVAGLVGLLFIRFLIFSDDEDGATIVIVAFWLVASGLLLKLVMALSKGEGGWEYLFLLIALLAFVVSAILGEDAIGPVTFIVFLMSIIGLAVVWLRRWRGRSVRQ